MLFISCGQFYAHHSSNIRGESHSVLAGKTKLVFTVAISTAPGKLVVVAFHQIFKMALHFGIGRIRLIVATHWHSFLEG